MLAVFRAASHVEGVDYFMNRFFFALGVAVEQDELLFEQRWNMAECLGTVDKVIDFRDAMAFNSSTKKLFAIVRRQTLNPCFEL
jgi:hypothetical protein